MSRDASPIEPVDSNDPTLELDIWGMRINNDLDGVLRVMDRVRSIVKERDVLRAAAREYREAVDECEPRYWGNRQIEAEQVLDVLLSDGA
jgi:hypothetical protein